MGLWKEQYQIGRSIFYAINCSRWNPEGRVLKINPTLREIDDMFRKFRKSLKKLQRDRILKKDGPLYIPNLARFHDSYCPIPLRGDKAYSFRLSDITYAKWVMKSHRELFHKLLDWNNLELCVKLLRNKKLKSPKLTAQIIFAVWQFQADV
jgi:hypothetical protein